jgi:hypothetical protein
LTLVVNTKRNSLKSFNQTNELALEFSDKLNLSAKLQRRIKSKSDDYKVEYTEEEI